MMTGSGMADWAAKRCQACRPGTAAMSAASIKSALKDLTGWSYKAKAISKMYSFKDYYHTMAFVSAVASVAHAEDHHPDLEVGYNKCAVTYSTHSVGGVSENDVICAAKVEQWAAAAVK
jgi:4a-hydroxytetrahydrobiopterin dehydratase